MVEYMVCVRVMCGKVWYVMEYDERRVVCRGMVRSETI